jgi:hypothetical protein
VILWNLAPTGFTEAWHNSVQFWVRTGLAIAHHPLAVLACAVVPAAERAYLMLETRPIPRWKLTLLEAVLTVWRVLICVVAVWVTVTPEEWRSLVRDFSSSVRMQQSLQRLGAYLGRNLHVLVWELVFFFAAFLLLQLAIRGVVNSGGRLDGLRRKALVSVLRNLLLVPVALIYLVELMRPTFF